MFALVHQPVPANEMLTNKESVKALEKEWTKLEGKDAWKIDTVREKSEVAEEARKTERKIHFGRLMQLCHIKNYQLDRKLWQYKGRIVFRGDNVRDENGQFAVFSEQGTSASHLMAARVVDALAHMPGKGDEDSDATGACTQIYLGKDCPDTWIELPKNRCPKAWHSKFTCPV